MSPSPSHSRRTLSQRWYPGVRISPCTAVRLAGFVPVLLVIAVIVFAYITAVPATLFPLRSTHPLLVYPLLILFHFIYLNVIANYLLLVLADPGTTPPDWKASPPSPRNRSHPPPDDDEAHRLLSPPSALKPPPRFAHAHLMHERAYDGSLRYCRFCAAYKPDRAHHCSVCRRCILRMDHHCVFVNNCVSFYNHKFFISFVAYAFAGCLFVAVVSFPTFAAVLSEKPRIMKVPQRGGGVLARLLAGPVHSGLHALQRFHLSEYANLEEMSSALKTIALIGYITSAAFAFALAIFVVLHFYLVAKGRTTIEMYELTDQTRAQRVLEYDLGPAKNFRKVFGTVPLCWFLPTRAYVQGDGITYERRIQPEHEANAV